MKLYEITLKPKSGFGTPLKGDTIFGYVCWQVSENPSLAVGGIETLMGKYPEKPYAVFSSAFPVINGTKTQYALKRPEIPPSKIFPSGGNRCETIKNAKENKEKKWVLVEKGSPIDLAESEFISEEALCKILQDESGNRSGKIGNISVNISQTHNTINRLTGATGTGAFAPFEKENIYFYPGICLVVFVLLDPDATDIESIVRALERIGMWGFGRDASIGKGRFSVEGYDLLDVPIPDGNVVCYTLAPSVPDMDLFIKAYFKTFTRFGKHGAQLSTHKNPFKNPVIMADEAAVFLPKDKSVFERPYLGKAVTGLSKAMPETVNQGYTPYLPMILEQDI